MNPRNWGPGQLQQGRVVDRGDLEIDARLRAQALPEVASMSRSVLSSAHRVPFLSWEGVFRCGTSFYTHSARVGRLATDLLEAESKDIEAPKTRLPIEAL